MLQVNKIEIGRGGVGGAIEGWYGRLSLFPKQGLFQQYLEKAPGQNWEKKIDLTSTLGEISNIEHYKGSKIYTQNQVILDCFMPSIPLKH